MRSYARPHRTDATPEAPLRSPELAGDTPRVVLKGRKVWVLINRTVRHFVLNDQRLR